MKIKRKYTYNEKTFAFELYQSSSKEKMLKAGLVLVVGIVCFFVCFYLYSSVLKFDTPKHRLLAGENRELLSRLELIKQQLEGDDERLSVIQRRDNIVYRPIFGMDEIAPEVRDAGFGGVDRYERYLSHNHGDQMADVARKMDILSKKAYIQSRSFDDVEMLAARAGGMASSVPSINPVSPGPRIRITSSFGYRLHPIKKYIIFHEGIDFSGPIGEPIYATGDGVVESVKYGYFGYGNCVVIDHGFGYKTRYAHLKSASVVEGQHISKGDQIALLGNTGQSTGPHLHYEVIYMGRQINPWNFMTPEMDREEYAKLIKRND